MKENGKSFGLLSGFFWGLDTVVLGLSLSAPFILSLGNNGSLVVTFIHDTFSFLLLMTLISITKKIGSFKSVLFSKSGLAIVVAALLGGPVGMSMYIYSIQLLGPSLSSSISAVYPIIGMFLAVILLKEKVRVHNIAGIIISVFAIILMGVSAISGIDNFELGLITILICAFSWGSEAVIIKAALKDDVSSEVALAIRQMTTTLAYSFIVVPIMGVKPLVSIVASPSIILFILLSGLFGTVSYLSYYKAIDLIGATQAMGLNITYPSWAFIIQFLLDGSFSPWLFFLSIVIMFGSLLSNDNPMEFFKKRKRVPY